MFYVIKNELIKMFGNRRFQICLLIEIFLNIILIIQSLFQQSEYMNVVNFCKNNSYNLECPFSAFNVFLLCNSTSKISLIYPYILPLLSAMVYGDSLFLDIRNKEKSKVLNLEHNIKYCFSKLIRAFINGFSLCFISLSIGFVLTLCFFPMIKPEISTGYFPLGFRGTMFSEMYLNSPMVYVLVIILLYSIISGVSR